MLFHNEWGRLVSSEWDGLGGFTSSFELSYPYHRKPSSSI